MPDEYEIGPIDPGELRPFLEAVTDAFQEDLHDDDAELWSRMVEPERALVARSGRAIVAGSALITMQLAIPGAVAKTAGVTGVGVDPVHRRRGLLHRLMRAHLGAIRERGEETLSVLWASEAGIYGRWGYGQATRSADLTVHSPDAQLLAGAAPGRPHAGSPPDLLAHMRAVYAAIQPGYPGLNVRDDLWWEDVIADFEHRRDGSAARRWRCSPPPAASTSARRAPSRTPAGRSRACASPGPRPRSRTT